MVGGYDADFGADARHFPVILPKIPTIASDSLNLANTITRCKFGVSLLTASKSTITSPAQLTGHSGVTLPIH